MHTKTLLPSLLLAFAAGIAAHAHAADDEAKPLSPQTCESILHELDAVGVHVREARTDRAEEATTFDRYRMLALELETHLQVLQANLPAPTTQRAQASLLLSDMHDALVLIRSATHLDARRLAVRRLEDDQRFYNRVMDTLGCSTVRSTAL